MKNIGNNVKQGAKTALVAGTAALAGLGIGGCSKDSNPVSSEDERSVYLINARFDAATNTIIAENKNGYVGTDSITVVKTNPLPMQNMGTFVTGSTGLDGAALNNDRTVASIPATRFSGSDSGKVFPNGEFALLFGKDTADYVSIADSMRNPLGKSNITTEQVQNGIHTIKGTNSNAMRMQADYGFGTSRDSSFARAGDSSVTGSINLSQLRAGAEVPVVVTISNKLYSFADTLRLINGINLPLTNLRIAPSQLFARGDTTSKIDTAIVNSKDSLLTLNAVAIDGDKIYYSFNDTTGYKVMAIADSNVSMRGKVKPGMNDFKAHIQDGIFSGQEANLQFYVLTDLDTANGAVLRNGRFVTQSNSGKISLDSIVSGAQKYALINGKDTTVFTQADSLPFNVATRDSAIYNLFPMGVRGNIGSPLAVKVVNNNNTVKGIKVLTPTVAPDSQAVIVVNGNGRGLISNAASNDASALVAQMGVNGYDTLKFKLHDGIYVPTAKDDGIVGDTIKVVSIPNPIDSSEIVSVHIPDSMIIGRPDTLLVDTKGKSRNVFTGENGNQVTVQDSVPYLITYHTLGTKIISADGKNWDTTVVKDSTVVPNVDSTEITSLERLNALNDTLVLGNAFKYVGHTKGKTGKMRDTLENFLKYVANNVTDSALLAKTGLHVFVDEADGDTLAKIHVVAPVPVDTMLALYGHFSADTIRAGGNAAFTVDSAQGIGNSAVVTFKYVGATDSSTEILPRKTAVSKTYNQAGIVTVKNQNGKGLDTLVVQPAIPPVDSVVINKDTVYTGENYVVTPFGSTALPTDSIDLGLSTGARYKAKFNSGLSLTAPTNAGIITVSAGGKSDSVFVKKDDIHIKYVADTTNSTRTLLDTAAAEITKLGHKASNNSVLISGMQFNPSEYLIYKKNEQDTTGGASSIASMYTHRTVIVAGPKLSQSEIDTKNAIIAGSEAVIIPMCGISTEAAFTNFRTTYNSRL